MGILVDDATVTIENINFHIEQGKDVETAILMARTRLPCRRWCRHCRSASCSFRCSCWLELLNFYSFRWRSRGVRHWPPTSCPHAGAYAGEVRSSNDAAAGQRAPRAGALSGAFSAEKMRERYLAARHGCPQRPALCGDIPGSGGDRLLAFPSPPRPRSGFLPPSTAARSSCTCARVPARVSRNSGALRCHRGHHPQGIRRLRTGVDNLGLPYSGINLAYSTSGPVGPGYADIFVNLKEGHKPTAGYVRALRKRLSADFPSTTFSFLPADMITQILNFGLPSPIDVQTVGFNVPANRAFANALLQRLHSVPGVVDLHIHQTGDYPQFNVDVDRTKAQLVGLTEQAVASNMLVSLSGSFQTSPSFWVDPKSGTQYQVATQTRSSAWKA